MKTIFSETEEKLSLENSLEKEFFDIAGSVKVERQIKWNKKRASKKIKGENKNFHEH